MLLSLLFACSSVVTGPDSAPLVVLSALTLPAFTTTLAYPQLVLDGADYRWEVREVDYESDTVVSLSDHLDRCGETHDYFARWAAASEGLLAASDEGEDGEAFCEAMPAFLDEMDAAAAALPQIGKVATLSLCTSCSGVDGAVVIGGDELVGVALSLDGQPEPTSLAARFDAERCGAAAEEPADGDGYWWFEDGTADLGVDLFGAYSGSVEARAGENLGGGKEEIETLDLNFSTSVCAAPEVARLVRF